MKLVLFVMKNIGIEPLVMECVLLNSIGLNQSVFYNCAVDDGSDCFVVGCCI